MASADVNSCAVSFELNSDEAFLHSAVHRVEDFARACGVEEVTTISVVMRELLANAITHGNRYLPFLKVNVHAEYAGAGAFRITVQDEGEGFDYASLDTKLPDDPRGIRRRGHILIRNLCRSVEFNGAGNQVTVLLDVGDKAGLRNDA